MYRGRLEARRFTIRSTFTNRRRSTLFTGNNKREIFSSLEFRPKLDVDNYTRSNNMLIF